VKAPVLPILGLVFASCIAGCSDDSSGGGARGATALLPCTKNQASPQAVIDSLVPSVSRVEARQRLADEYGDGFRVQGSDAEIGYLSRLAAELTALGATDVRIEPYAFPSFTVNGTSLSVVQGASPGPVRVAGFVPNSGTTGPAGVEAPAIYLGALGDVNAVAALTAALSEQDPGNVLLGLQRVLDGLASPSVPAVIAGANVSGQIVVYDVPKIGIPLSLLYATALNVNNSSGTMSPGQTIIYVVGQLALTGYVNEALHAAGAVGALGIIDWPVPASDGTYNPFGPVLSPASIPALFLDRDTGAAVKQQISDGGAIPPHLRLTLDATRRPATTSYNVSTLVPGSCPGEVLVSSHSDGPNSIEDDGPAAILSIVDYFLNAPAEQRLRPLRIVFTGGHMETDGGGSPGIQAYMAAHDAELSKTLTAFEIEHVGAREWVELSPGMMGLSGRSEVQVIFSNAGPVQQQELVIYSQAFDRSFALVPGPMSIFGESRQWFTTASVPLIQFLTGPLYLLNGPMLRVSDEFTDYELERRQIAAFIQMILNLNTHAPADLRPGID